ncbi:MAG TPA: diguanylate cyclase [Candidatus Limnocylindria bacterium]|nr:diguanylate cyclase [Candidatus Limnocylindria bacterium]
MAAWLAAAALVIVVPSLVASTLDLELALLRAMRLDAALSYVLLGGAVLWTARHPGAGGRLGAALLAAGAVSIGGLTSARYVTVGHPGPAALVGMSPLTAVAVVVLGLATILAVFGKGRPMVVGLSVTGGVVGLLGLLTTAFGAAPPPILADATTISPQSAATAILLGVAVTTLLPGGGPLALFWGHSDVSRLSRRMLAAAIGVPIALALLRLRGEQAGWYDTAYGVALSVIGTVVLLVLVIWRGGLAARQAEFERELAQQERDRVFDLSLDMLAVAAPDGRFVRVNPAWEGILGYPRRELLGRPFLEFVHPDDVDATAYETRKLFDEGKQVHGFQNRYRHADGRWLWLEWTAQPSPDRTRVFAVARDITTRKLEEERLIKRAAALAVRNERLAERAVRDPLTTLHNRRYFDEAVARMDAGLRDRGDQQPVSAIVFDLDNFGAFNKQFGHQAGDVVLRHFADILRRRFRGGDLIARYGGEEFAAVLPGASRQDAAAAAEWVRHRLVAEPITFDGQPLHATVSAGCAELADGSAMRDLLAAADVALTMAKRAGRNTVVEA